MHHSQGFKLQALFTAPSNYRDDGFDSFTISSLLVYGGAYWFLAGITYGAFIPSGLFTPSLILGGCLGWGRGGGRGADVLCFLYFLGCFSQFSIFHASSSISPRRAFAEVLILMGVPHVDVGMYALLGSGAFMGGLMRMVAAMVRRGRIRARGGCGVELFRGRLSVVHLPLWPRLTLNICLAGPYICLAGPYPDSGCSLVLAGPHLDGDDHVPAAAALPHDGARHLKAGAWGGPHGGRMAHGGYVGQGAWRMAGMWGKPHGGRMAHGGYVGQATH